MNKRQPHLCTICDDTVGAVPKYTIHEEGHTVLAHSSVRKFSRFSTLERASKYAFFGFMALLRFAQSLQSAMAKVQKSSENHECLVEITSSYFLYLTTKSSRISDKTYKFASKYNNLYRVEERKLESGCLRVVEPYTIIIYGG